MVVRCVRNHCSSRRLFAATHNYSRERKKKSKRIQYQFVVVVCFSFNFWICSVSFEWECAQVHFLILVRLHDDCKPSKWMQNSFRFAKTLVKRSHLDGIVVVILCIYIVLLVEYICSFRTSWSSSFCSSRCVLCQRLLIDKLLFHWSKLILD